MDAYFWGRCYASPFFLWGGVLVGYIQLLSELFPLQSGFSQSLSYFFGHFRLWLNIEILSKDM